MITDNTDREELEREPPQRVWIQFEHFRSRSILVGEPSLQQRSADDVEYVRAAVAAEKGDGSMTAEQIERASLIAESRGIDEETAQELVYLRDRASAEEPLRLAVGSLLDIVSELTVALEQGNKPDETFTSLVVETITKHKKGLGFYG